MTPIYKYNLYMALVLAKPTTAKNQQYQNGSLYLILQNGVMVCPVWNSYGKPLHLCLCTFQTQRHCLVACVTSQVQLGTKVNPNDMSCTARFIVYAPDAIADAQCAQRNLPTYNNNDNPSCALRRQQKTLCIKLCFFVYFVHLEQLHKKRPKQQYLFLFLYNT